MQSSRKNRLFSAAVVIGGMLTVTGVAGCGRGGLPMADVHGEVKFDGQPIETGSIAFHPEDGLGPSTGGEIKNGQYAVRVPPGAKKIEIRGSKRVGTAQAHAGEPGGGAHLHGAHSSDLQHSDHAF